ncbi:hypothetical protein GCM10022204_43960 [Microlunatus aurantiacus]|uniref:Mutator family transposase n=1 Tax=Microlunatus aurantiacus TaxID=446786 RepID=A0ABP7EGS4_9ACTN
MTADPNPNDLSVVLEQLQRADPDLLRSMLTAFVQALTSADADTACGAEFGTRSPDRVNQRNGYRHREWDTRAGTIELAIPKLREGSYFPRLATRAPQNGPNGPWSRSWPPPACSASRPGGWRSWSRPWGSPGCRSRRS